VYQLQRLQRRAGREVPVPLAAPVRPLRHRGTPDLSDDRVRRRVAPYGDIGAHLHRYRHERDRFADPDKGFFALGDVAALVDPTIATWEEVECPSIGWGLSYRFDGELGRILRCADVDRDRAFGLLYERLESRYG
jgi:hypothetical protein